MSNASLHHVLAINQELASLADAGVPICLGPAVTSTRRALERINKSLELRTSLGQNIDAAIADNPDLPSVYQHALLAGLSTGSTELTLAGVTRRSAAQDEFRSAAGRAMVQPLIVLALAYCGFILLCILFVPAMSGVYEQLRQVPGLPVRLLEACRAAMPVWIPLVPIVVLLAIVLWRRRKGELPHWIPGARRYLKAVTHALFAEELVRLVETKMPLAEAAQLASGATGDAALVEACNSLTNGENARLATLPPLLRWALTGNLDEQTLPEVLQFAAHTYRQSAERMAVVWQTALPIVLGSLLGGTTVLVFGLSVFWPYIEMLRELAR